MWLEAEGLVYVPVAKVHGKTSMVIVFRAIAARPLVAIREGTPLPDTIH